MLSNRNVYLVHGKRTPFGKFGGSLKDVTPVDLAVHATKSTLDDLKLKGTDVDQYILGNVVTTTTDTMYGGRHLALKSGAKQETPGHCVNRLCGSGAQSILDATRMILLGEGSAMIAAGTENMSNIPHLVYGSRFGTKYGSLKTVDMLMDSLTDQYGGCPMGITAENLAEKYSISREECEEFAVNSHLKAEAAYQAGFFKDEISPFEARKATVEKDEHVRADSSKEGMAGLRPSFKQGGVVTAATASGIVDGASSTLIADEEFVKARDLNSLARIVDGTVVGVDPTIMGIGPVPAIRTLLERNKLTFKDIDLIEINEAFAAQTLACQKELGFEMEKLNIWGGAIALGHPLGASGNRITLSLARQLKAKGLKRGIASACIGGGQGIAILIEV
ncbi:MAG: acetyl-CoA C-acyltransferase [Halobacteriovoraceae bacterium]|nr:acetyl-CoA C-acyltransferase [Halobacteriovoraceae bacterium]|tara:strand:+ start:14978 stop:16150 length:1173 start_codon:yes stop_codon:yes gene_type:complete